MLMCYAPMWFFDYYKEKEENHHQLIYKKKNSLKYTTKSHNKAQKEIMYDSILYVRKKRK